MAFARANPIAGAIDGISSDENFERNKSELIAELAGAFITSALGCVSVGG